MTDRAIHLIYIPAADGRTDRVLDIIETQDIDDVLLEVQANPGSIAMQLDCDEMEDL